MNVSPAWLLKHGFRVESRDGVMTYDYGGVVLEDYGDLGWRVSIDSEHMPDSSVENVKRLLACMGRELPE